VKENQQFKQDLFWSPAVPDTHCKEHNPGSMSPTGPGPPTGEYTEGLHCSASYCSVVGKTVLTEKWKHRCLQSRLGKKEECKI